jgi:hypothetical protein
MLSFVHAYECTHADTSVLKPLCCGISLNKNCINAFSLSRMSNGLLTKQLLINGDDKVMLCCVSSISVLCLSCFYVLVSG